MLCYVILYHIILYYVISDYRRLCCRKMNPRASRPCRGSAPVVSRMSCVWLYWFICLLWSIAPCCFVCVFVVLFWLFGLLCLYVFWGSRGVQLSPSGQFPYGELIISSPTTSSKQNLELQKNKLECHPSGKICFEQDQGFVWNYSWWNHSQIPAWYFSAKMFPYLEHEGAECLVSLLILNHFTPFNIRTWPQGQAQNNT